MPKSALQAEIKKRKPFDVPEEETYLNLQRTCSVLAGHGEQLLKEHGTSEAQYNVLRILRGARLGGDEALPSLEIAARMITRVPDITRLIDRLEAAGFVQRRRCTHDRRVVWISITKPGLDLLATLDKPIIDLVRRQLGHMSRTELTSLNKLLVKARRTAHGPSDSPQNTS